MYKKNCIGRKLFSYFVETFYLKMFLRRTKPKGVRKRGPRPAASQIHKGIQPSPGRRDAPVKVVLPFPKQGPETQQGSLTHRNICYYRLGLSISSLESPLLL